MSRPPARARHAVGRRRPALGQVVAWLAPVLLVLVMLGPSLLGARLFAAGNLIDYQGPWEESSTAEHVTNTCVSDTVDGALPTALVYRDRIAAGDVPALWDNTAAAGVMLASAPPGGVNSPIFIASLPFGDVAFPAWIKLFEIGVAVAGTVLWARRLGLSTPAGLVGGLLYVTGSFMVLWTNWPQTRTAAFFPLVFWAVERLVQDRTVRSALPLPLVVAAMILGGFPAIAVHTLYFAAAYAVVRLVVLNRRPADGAVAGGRAGRWRRWGRA
ncbi:hypothetical protein, partial [Georgenia subflava]